MKRKIHIAIASYSGGCKFQFFNSFMRALVEASQKGWTCHLAVAEQDAMITRARNILASRFLADKDATDLVFVDDDVMWGQNDFVRLIEHDVDIVAASYMRKDDNAQPPFVYRSFEGRALRFEPNGLMEVYGAPTGLMRIRRRVFDALIAKAPDDWYQDQQVAPDLERIRMFFEFEFDRASRGYFSEDYAFCRRARAAGFKIYLDPEIEASHIGQKVWTGKFGDWFREQMVTPELRAAAGMLEPPAPISGSVA